MGLGKIPNFLQKTSFDLIKLSHVMVNLLKGPDKGPDNIAMSVVNLLKGLGDTEEAAKTPAVHLGDGLPPIPAKIVTRTRTMILKGEFEVGRDGVC